MVETFCSFLPLLVADILFLFQNVVMDKEFSGIIKRLDTERGFGFINYTSFKDNSNQDIFFHSSSIEMGLTLIEGDEVVFDIVAGKKGPVRPLLWL